MKFNDEVWNTVEMDLTHERPAQHICCSEYTCTLQHTYFIQFYNMFVSVFYTVHIQLDLKTPHQEKNAASRPPHGEKVATPPPPYSKKNVFVHPGGGRALSPAPPAGVHVFVYAH